MNARVERDESKFKVLEGGDAEVPPESVTGVGRPLLILAVVVFIAMGAWIAYSLLHYTMG